MSNILAAHFFAAIDNYPRQKVAAPPLFLKKSFPSPVKHIKTIKFIPHPSSLIPHPSSFILHPSSLIPHPSSLKNNPASIAPAGSYRQTKNQSVFIA
jgi:hypothetical protein